MRAAAALNVWLLRLSKFLEERSFTLRGMERTPFALMQQCPPGSPPNLRLRRRDQVGGLIHCPGRVDVADPFGTHNLLQDSGVVLVEASTNMFFGIDVLFSEAASEAGRESTTR
jgi:hypothetical protein